MNFFSKLFGSNPVDPMADWQAGKPQNESRRNMFKLAGAAAVAGGVIQLPKGVRMVPAAPTPTISAPNVYSRDMIRYYSSVDPCEFTAAIFTISVAQERIGQPVKFSQFNKKV